MSLREFLNVAHAVLVEELVRPKLMSGIQIPGMSLADALDATAFYSEGYVIPAEEEDTNGDRPVASQRNPDYQSAKRQLTEEEMVAKNNAALAWLEQRMSGVKGGLGAMARG